MAVDDNDKAMFVCDGCGRRQQGDENPVSEFSPHGWVKPYGWYVRTDKDGSQHACCRGCILLTAEKTGKTSLVLPI